MTIRSQMNLIMGAIQQEQLELFAPELGKLLTSTFVYTLESRNIIQSAPNMVKMYVSIRSWMSLIMDLNRTIQNRSYLPLNLKKKKKKNLTLFTL